MRIDGKRVCLPTLGWLKCYETIGAKIAASARLLSATVSQNGAHWDISLCYELEHQTPKHSGPSVGVDTGIKTLATLSDGKTYQNPRHLQKSFKTLKRLQRWHSRKTKGSQNNADSRKRLARWHSRIANRRNDALHKLTTSLAQTYSLVCIEDLNVRGMSQNHALAAAILDCGWGEFRRQLEYKCPYYGGSVAVIDRFFPSSKTCSVCQLVRPTMTLNTRQWRCECGARHERDLNAARNILAAGSAVFARRPESAGLVTRPGETLSNETGTEAGRTSARV